MPRHNEGRKPKRHLDAQQRADATGVYYAVVTIYRPGRPPDVRAPVPVPKGTDVKVEVNPLRDHT